MCLEMHYSGGSEILYSPAVTLKFFQNCACSFSSMVSCVLGALGLDV